MGGLETIIMQSKAVTIKRKNTKIMQHWTIEIMETTSIATMHMHDDQGKHK